MVFISVVRGARPWLKRLAVNKNHIDQLESWKGYFGEMIFTIDDLEVSPFLSCVTQELRNRAHLCMSVTRYFFRTTRSILVRAYFIHVHNCHSESWSNTCLCFFTRGLMVG